MYFDKISDLFASLSLKPGYLLITGDFNIHAEDRIVRQFLDIVASFRFQQHVNVPTPVAGHTLDLVITRENCDLLYSSPDTHYMMTSH